jgi:hypothetical protein
MVVIMYGDEYKLWNRPQYLFTFPQLRPSALDLAIPFSDVLNIF